MDAQLKKHIDNIVWYIPIKKLRNSLRNYLIALIEYNEYLKRQNYLILKYMSTKLQERKTYDNQEKEISYDGEISDFIKKYNKINSSYDKKCIFYVGHSAGFFSEFNNMVLAIIYCLLNKIEFKLYSKTANFSSNGLGWEEFFIPLCTQAYDEFNKYYNFRYGKDIEKVEADFYKQYANIDYFTQDVFDVSRSTLKTLKNIHINELEINGNFKEVFGLIAKNIYKFNDNTKQEIYDLIKNLNLPKNYVAVHIRSGDKITEASLISYDTYMEAVKKYSDLKDIFIFTDDYSIVDKIIKEYGNTYNIYTLTNKNEKGYYLHQLNEKSNNEKHKEFIKLFAMIEVCRQANICIGSYTVNPDSFLSAVMEEGKFIEIENQQFYIA